MASSPRTTTKREARRRPEVRRHHRKQPARWNPGRVRRKREQEGEGYGEEERKGREKWGYLERGGTFYTSVGGVSRIPKVQIGFQGGELAHFCHVLEPSSVESAADQEHSNSLGEVVLYSQSLRPQKEHRDRRVLVGPD